MTTHLPDPELLIDVLEIQKPALYEIRHSPRRGEPPIERFEERSREREDSARRGNYDIVHPPVASKVSEAYNEPTDENVCYMFGLPFDVTNDELYDEFAKRQIYQPKSVDRFKTSKFSNY